MVVSKNLSSPRRRTSLLAPRAAIANLLRIVARLRGPRGCPWDRKQTHKSIKQDLIEECYEAVDAIEAGDASALREELGDLLLQIVFHAQLAHEKRKFSFNDVAATITDKLIRRHPHVFGRKKLRTADQVLAQWHELKRGERREHRSATDGVPKHLPALMKAESVQKKVARVGFDWPRRDGVVQKIEEELAELKRALRTGRKAEIDDELGDLLFAVVNLARWQKRSPEDLLNYAIKKFIGRFRRLESEVARRGRRLEDCSLTELDAIWENHKRHRHSGSSARRP